MQASEIIEELRSRHLVFEATGCHTIAQFFKETADLIDGLNGTIEQIRWERDLAMKQLEEHGIPFGGKADDVIRVCRCKDCKHYDGKWCLLLDMVNSDMGDWFCGYGKRKDDTL
jgi:hypothetical protein